MYRHVLYRERECARWRERERERERDDYSKGHSIMLTLVEVLIHTLKCVSVCVFHILIYIHIYSI